MTLVRMTKKCPKCRKTYTYNPDVGKGFFCPHCGGLGLSPEQEKPKGQEKIREVIKNLFQ